MKHVPMFQRIDYDLETGCWNWTGFKGKKGYGRTCHEGVQYQAHRVSAHIFLGFDLSSKLQVCHKCDNPSCINPKHFFIGTNKDNAHDASLKGRIYNRRKMFCPYGHPYNEENTYFYKRKNWIERHCKACWKMRAGNR